MDLYDFHDLKVWVLVTPALPSRARTEGTGKHHILGMIHTCRVGLKTKQILLSVPTLSDLCEF